MLGRTPKTLVGIVATVVVLVGAFLVATQVLGGGDPTERAREAFEEDRSLAPFRGELGDFMVVDEITTERPCPGPYDPVHDLSVIRESELYSPLFGAEAQAGVCSDGTIVGVVSFGEAVLSRSYFFSHPQLQSDAPRERLTLITVAGRPALAEVPIADALVSSAQLLVIERFPERESPGIQLGITTVQDLDGAIELAGRVLESRP